MFVGGEFYADTRWRVEQPVIFTRGMTFLNGGKASLIVISEYLLEHGISKILLPSYLCPTIVNTLEGCGLTCDYYPVRADLSIDLDELARKVAHHKAVYFINYFGFRHSAVVREYLAGLRQQGVMVVEDNAQAGFVENSIGDFVFNSMRKLVPYDGGYLVTPFDVTPYIKRHQGCPNRRLPVIRLYRKRLGDYLFEGIGGRGELEGLYEQAEHDYETDTVVEGDPQERWQIEHLDWQAIRQVRRENYRYLLGLIAEVPGVTPIFPALQEDNMPMGLPVYVSGVPRDWLFDELGNAGIGLTVHWDELLRDPRLNGDVIAVNMASRMLTLVIDQRTSHKQMDYLVENLVMSIRNYRI